MTGIEIAGLLKDYGPWGLCGLFLLAISRLYDHNQTLHGRISEIFAKALVAIEASTMALVESRGTMQNLAKAIEAVGKALDELSHEAEGHDREVRHGLNNAAAALGGLQIKLEKICDRIERLEKPIERIGERAERAEKNAERAPHNHAREPL